jgi:hypothetical protein
MMANITPPSTNYGFYITIENKKKQQSDSPSHPPGNMLLLFTDFEILLITRYNYTSLPIGISKNTSLAFIAYKHTSQH